MKIKMLVSMCVMPEFNVFEQGETYAVDAVTAEQWIAAGNAEAAPDDPPADDAPKPKKRKPQGGGE